MSTFTLTLLAAEKPFYTGECESLEFPAIDGQYGVMAHHRDMIAAVMPGVLRFRTPDGEWHRAAVSEGIVKVENNDVLVLVDTAEKPEEIDAVRAARAAEEAKDALLHQQSIRDFRIARAELARAVGRLKAKGKKPINDA